MAECCANMARKSVVPDRIRPPMNMGALWLKITGLPMRATFGGGGTSGLYRAMFGIKQKLSRDYRKAGLALLNRRGRRAKTDRIDVGMLLRALIAWCRGERHVWSIVRIPSVEQEDLRRSHRERSRLVCERTAHINRIKGLLFGQGIRGLNIKTGYNKLELDQMVTGESPPRTRRRSSISGRISSTSALSCLCSRKK